MNHHLLQQQEIIMWKQEFNNSKLRLSSVSDLYESSKLYVAELSSQIVNLTESLNASKMELVNTQDTYLKQEYLKDTKLNTLKV
jgi:hypothetical protein